MIYASGWLEGNDQDSGTDHKTEQITQRVTNNASDTGGSVAVGIIGIIVLGTVVGGAVALGKKASNKKVKDTPKQMLKTPVPPQKGPEKESEKKEDPLKFRMYVNKQFGDTLKYDEPGKLIQARIEQIDSKGVVIDRVDLTSQIQIFTHSKGLEVSNVALTPNLRPRSD